MQPFAVLRSCAAAGTFITVVLHPCNCLLFAMFTHGVSGGKCLSHVPTQDALELRRCSGLQACHSGSQRISNPPLRTSRSVLSRGERCFDPDACLSWTRDGGHVRQLIFRVQVQLRPVQLHRRRARQQNPRRTGLPSAARSSRAPRRWQTSSLACSGSGTRMTGASSSPSASSGQSLRRWC